MILITGSNGQLGSSLSDLLDEKKAYFVDVKGCNILDISSIFKIVDEHKIKCIINCAAYTNVDGAESDQERAFAVNELGVKNIADVCASKSIKLIHISTDYVFKGDRKTPLTEKDSTNPQSVYGKSKLKGEQSIKQSGCQAAIIRTSWLYSHYGNNFVKTMLNLGKTKDQIRVVNDQFGSPTNATDLAKVILVVIKKMKHTGTEIYHYSNEGTVSWMEFAKEIFKLSGLKCKVIGISTKDYGAAAFRPYYSHLSTDKIKNEFDIVIPNWRDSLGKQFSS